MGAKRTSATVFPIRDIPLDFPAPASIGVSDRRPTMAAWQNARRSPGSGWWERRNQAALMETTPMSKPTKDLSVPQLLILTTAASRPDRMVMPLPSTLRARGASQQRLLTSVLKLALVEEVPTDTLILSWRHDEQGQHCNSPRLAWPPSPTRARQHPLSHRQARPRRQPWRRRRRIQRQSPRM
jgi:hypothetical protein